MLDERLGLGATPRRTGGSVDSRRFGGLDIEMSAGHQFTVPTAQYLLQELAGKPLWVIFDHGSTEESSQIISWFGPAYVPPLRPKQLAQLDIAVIHRETNQAITLIEIEDSSNNPKTLMSDLLALLLGSGITVKGGQAIYLGSWTTFIVLAKVEEKQTQSEYRERIQFLNRQISHIHKVLQTPNAAVGQIMLDTFISQTDLNQKVSNYVNRGIGSIL